MALDQTTKDTILSRIAGGEGLPDVFGDLDVSQEDRAAFRVEYPTQVSAARTAKCKALSLAALTVEQLDTRIAQLTTNLSELQAEKDSR